MDIREKLKESLGKTKFIHPKDKTQDGFLAEVGRFSATSDTVELVVINPGGKEQLEIIPVESIEKVIETD